MSSEHRRYGQLKDRAEGIFIQIHYAHLNLFFVIIKICMGQTISIDLEDWNSLALTLGILYRAKLLFKNANAIMISIPCPRVQKYL